MKAEFDRIESKMNKISIDQIKKDAKESVSILEDDFSAANHTTGSPRISEGMKKKIENQKSSPKTPPLTPSSGKNLASPSTEDLSSRREDIIPEEEVFDEATEKPITIEELEAELEEELKKDEDENPFKIDLQELNSLQEVKSMFRISREMILYRFFKDSKDKTEQKSFQDIGEEKKMKNVQMDLSQFKKEKKSILDKGWG